MARLNSRCLATRLCTCKLRTCKQVLTNKQSHLHTQPDNHTSQTHEQTHIHKHIHAHTHVHRQTKAHTHTTIHMHTHTTHSCFMPCFSLQQGQGLGPIMDPSMLYATYRWGNLTKPTLKLWMKPGGSRYWARLLPVLILAQSHATTTACARWGDR